MAQERNLNLVVTNDTVCKMLAVGREFDLNKNGPFDSRMGCVNFWCSPNDRPSCWDAPIIPAALDYPRSFVGTLYWRWSHNEILQENDKAELFISADAYELADSRKISLEDWKIILDWVEEKVKFLIRMAQIHPDV